MREVTSGRCKGTTRTGERCRLRAKPDDDFCSRHVRGAPTDPVAVTTNNATISIEADVTEEVDGQPIGDVLPLSLTRRLAGLDDSIPAGRSLDSDGPSLDTKSQSPIVSLPRIVALIVGILAVWALFAMDQNVSGSGDLPLGPVGNSACRSAVQDVHSNVPEAIADAQRSVDALVAENPALAKYAAEAKRNLAMAAPEVHAGIDEAGRTIGC